MHSRIQFVRPQKKGRLLEELNIDAVEDNIV
jgi:hypothetical protein